MVASRRNQRGLSRLNALLALSFLVGAGCDSEPPPMVNIELFATQVNNTATDPLAEFSEVAKLVIRVKAEGQEDLTSAEPFSLTGSRQVALPPIPYLTDGTPQQIVLEGWSVDAAGDFLAPICVGRTAMFSITPEDEPITMRVQMARINSFARLTSAADGNDQVLSFGRVGHTVTQSPTGETLIAGGGAPVSDSEPWWTTAGVSTVYNSVELVNGDTQTATVHDVIPVNEAYPGLRLPRMWHTATAFETPDQSLRGVLFAGGYENTEAPTACPPAGGNTYASCTVEWYDPESGEIKILVPSLAKPRAGHTATLIDDSPTILFVGGDLDGQGTYEVWDPELGSPAGAIPLPDGSTRRFHAAVKAPILDEMGNNIDSVLIFGGESDTEALSTGLFFFRDQADQPIMIAHPAPLSKGPRTRLTASYVPAQNYVYFIGGFAGIDGTGVSAAIDVLDTKAVNWTLPFLEDGTPETPGLDDFNLVTARGGHTTSLVGDKMLVVLGGSSDTGTLDRAEIIHEYSPGGGQAPIIEVVSSCFQAECQSPLPPMPYALKGHQALVLNTGNLLLAGGVFGTGDTTPAFATDLYLFVPQ